MHTHHTMNELLCSISSIRWRLSRQSRNEFSFETFEVILVAAEEDIRGTKSKKGFFR